MAASLALRLEKIHTWSRVPCAAVRSRAVRKRAQGSKVQRACSAQGCVSVLLCSSCCAICKQTADSGTSVPLSSELHYAPAVPLLHCLCVFRLSNRCCQCECCHTCVCALDMSPSSLRWCFCFWVWLYPLQCDQPNYQRCRVKQPEGGGAAAAAAPSSFLAVPATAAVVRLFALRGMPSSSHKVCVALCRVHARRPSAQRPLRAARPLHTGRWARS